MHLVSAFSLVLLGLFGVLIGYFIGNFVKGKQVSPLENENKVLKDENQKLNKGLNASKKEVNKTQKQATLWKEKFDESKLAISNENTKYVGEAKGLKQEITELRKVNRSLSTDLQFSQANKEKIAKQYDNLNEKYKIELAELKEWKAGKDKFDREMRHLESQSKAADDRSKRLQHELAKIQHELNESRAFMTNLKILKAQNGKLNKDLKYWEQKHYDTNHELANVKKTLEAFDAEKASLVSSRDEANQLIKTLEVKVQDFKDKFVVMNDKYHKLLNNKTEFA